MSQIILPLIHTLSSDATLSAFVNAEHVMSVSPLNNPSGTPNGVDLFLILFSVLGTDGQVRTVEWKYSVSATAEADRDADIVLIIAAISTEIV